MRTFIQKKISTAIRIALLIFSGFAFSTLFVWIYSPSIVYRIDDYILEQYFKHYENRLQEAENILKSDQARGLSLLEELIDDLENIKKLDNLYRLKRRVFFDLVNAGRSIDYGKSLFWVDQWIDFDDRDLTAKVSKAQLLYGPRETRAEAVLYMESLYKEYPDIPTVYEARNAMQKNYKNFSK